MLRRDISTSVSGGSDGPQIELMRGYPKRDWQDRFLNLPWRGGRVTTITHPHFGPDPVEVYAIKVND